MNRAGFCRRYGSAGESGIIAPARVFSRRLSVSREREPLGRMSLLDTFFNGEVLLSSLPALLRGFINTLLLGLLSIAIGMPVGPG